MITTGHGTQPNESSLLQAAGFTLPALYHTVMRLSWTHMDPWRFLRGEAFLALCRDLCASLDRLPGQGPSRNGPQLILPFAVNEDTNTVACFQAAPKSPEILLVARNGQRHLQVFVDPRQGSEIFAALPSFADWLRMAVEDVIQAAAGEPNAVGAEGGLPRRPPLLRDEHGALPFEETRSERVDPRSSTRRHLLRMLRESEVDLDFVSAEAGDQPIVSGSVRRHHERIKQERGEQLYGDMLFVLTQHRYPRRMAKWLWARILEHQKTISRRLGRRAEITVASLDFLNLNEHLVEGSLVLCSEDELTQVADIALRDGLTGLFDQATFRVRLKRELERVHRYRTSLSLLMLDLDHFKRLNDEHGHLQGDHVLSVVGELLREELRAVDLPARYGGEEFAVLLPETEQPEAMRLAERLRQAIEHQFESDLEVTVSIGVASYPGNGVDDNALIDAADQALYGSKAAGRNRVSCASARPPANGLNEADATEIQ